MSDEEVAVLAEFPRIRTIGLLIGVIGGLSAPGVVLSSESKGQLGTDMHTGTEAFLGVRVLKADEVGSLKWSVELPKSCAGCRLTVNEFTSGQNPREFYFHFIAPASYDKIAGVHVAVDPVKVRSVLVGRTQVTFKRTADGITFDVPRNGPMLSDLSGFHTLPAYAAGDVTDFYTYIDTPSVETRVEHADEKRRNGPYTTGAWPAVERQAALNLEFAAKEAIVALGLDRSIRERGLGTILLMGFDTNYPTLGPEDAHSDNPPHWHMHFSWSHEPVIRQVGHLYIGPDGLLTENSVVDIISDKTYRFGRGQTHNTVTETGETLYTHTITPEGYFVLGASKGSCRLTPVAGGFHSGIDVTCSNEGYRNRVRVEDDLSHGRLQVFLNDHLVEEHLYNPDNGILKGSKIAYGDTEGPLSAFKFTDLHPDRSLERR